ncbi:hypothetical protein ACS0TY_031343 [Phlomoides rotata]
MENWDPQKMLDLYIHDYLERKNLQHSTDTLAQEANIQPKSIVINPTEGFLSDWWSLFWDVYNSRAGVNPSGELVTTSMPPQISASVPQIAKLVPPVVDVNYMLNICPPMTGLGLPNLLQTGDSSAAPWPKMGTLTSVVPPRILDPMLNDHDIMQFARMQPSTSGSSFGSQRRSVNNRRLSPLSQGDNIGTCLGRPITSELAPSAPRLIIDGVEQADAAHCVAARASGKLVIFEPSTIMASPAPLDDGSKGKNMQIEKNTQTKKLTPEDIEYFLSTEETLENMILPFPHTLPQDFPFRIVRTLHPTDNKLSCCDFSSKGRFLAAAGHEKKVIIWNLSLSSRETLQGHTQLITDVRFKPDSTMLATSSFDRTVKIWDASYANPMPCSLVGHEDQVMSVDFHPKSPNLLCSCDSNDIIRIWNLKDSSCLGFHKVRSCVFFSNTNSDVLQ